MNFHFFRFVTILYYLNDVEEGGETAFLIADNTTTTADVSIKCFKNDDKIILWRCG